MTRSCTGLAAAALVLLTSAGATAHASAPTVVREDVGAAVGQPVTLDGEQVHTVTRVERWYGGGMWQPQAGKAAVTFHVKIDAIQKTSVNELYYSLAGPGGETYSRVIVGYRQPDLHATNDLMPGRSTNGWVTFLVPVGQLAGLQVRYVMSAGFGSQLTVPLGTIPDSQRSRLGRTAVVAGEHAVTITKIDRPATLGMWKPMSGYTYLTVYAKVRALKPTSVERGFNVLTRSGAWAPRPLLGSRSPTFPYRRQLAAGRTVEGWVTFMVRKGQGSGLTLVYSLSGNRDTLLVPLS